MKNKIYQIYFNADQKSGLDPDFIPYNNSEANSPFFENEVILKLIATGKHLNCDYFGVVSWMIGYKIRPFRKAFTGQLLNEFLEKNSDIDILSVFGSHHLHNTFTHGGHGWTLPRLIQAVLDRVGHKVDVFSFKPSAIVYMNFMFCRPEIYEAYMREMLLPAVEAMCDINDDEIQSMIWMDSQYKKTIITKQEKDRFKKMFGVSYYPHHTFVCERLFSYWLTINKHKYSFKQLF
jgi:hypothetical protein